MTLLDPARVPLAGLSLIEASAGTGKTHTITTLVLRLLLEQAIDVRGVLVLTYTKAATAELRERIRGRIAELLFAIEADVAPKDDAALHALWEERRGERAQDRMRLARALRDFDEAAIFTIHGFCQRVLGERALESKTAFDVELVEDMAPLIEEVAVDLWERATWQRAPAVLRALRNQGLKIDEVRRLVSLAVHEPSLGIVPPLGERPSEPDASVFEAEHRAAVELWERERDSVIAAMTRPETIKQNTHRVEWVRDSHVPALDSLKDGVNGQNIAIVRKYTAAAIENATKKGARTPRNPFFDACTQLAAAYAPFEAMAEGLARYELGAMARDAREQIARRKRERGVQGFEDLLSSFSDALEAKSGDRLAQQIATRYPALLVDEFQDTDPVQYAIFRRLQAGGVKTMLLIGDPKQAIYGFRGADVFAYMQAARDAEDRVLRLGTNYRSDPGLVRAVNALFAPTGAFAIEGLTYEAVEPKPHAREQLDAPGAALDVLFVSRKGQPLGANDRQLGMHASVVDTVPAMVASDIVRFLSSGARIDGKAVVPEDIAVLCRTNRQGQLIQEALSERGVPVALDGDSSVFRSDTADELCRVLAALASPSDLRAVKSALATALLGWTAEALLALEEDDAQLAIWLGHIMRAHVRWLESGFVQAVHGFFADARVHERLLARRDGQRRLTDALHVVELLHVEASRERLGPLSLVRRLEGLCLDLDMPSTLAAESAQLRLESDEHAVRVTTVHRSKGLQYPIVYCPYLWHAWSPRAETAVRFHDDERNALIDVMGPDFEAHKARADEEDSAEALRLTYVALTRAKHRCSIVWGGFSSRPERTAIGRLLGVGDGSDDGLVSALNGWRERSSGAIGWRPLALADAVTYRRADEGEARVSARKLERVLPLGERLTSFSRIAKHAPRDNAELIAEGLDRDAVPAEEAQLAQATRDPSVPRVTLADFPAGPSAGTLVHSIFEQIDFRRSDPDELPRHTRLALAQGQLDVAAYAEPLARGIVETLETPLALGDAPFALADLERKARVDELEFMLELEPGSAFSSASIAAALARHGAPLHAPEYPDRVRALGQGAVSGFLRGFIDLVFRHGERFYVIDYKSNHLGDTAVDYAQPALRAAMIDHHYYLQAYLYTLALHRYLSARLAGYDYDKHVGGYAYLFLRGMAKAHAAGTGVLAERPPRALIEELSGLLTGGRS